MTVVQSGRDLAETAVQVGRELEEKAGLHGAVEEDEPTN